MESGNYNTVDKITATKVVAYESTVLLKSLINKPKIKNNESIKSFIVNVYISVYKHKSVISNLVTVW